MKSEQVSEQKGHQSVSPSLITRIAAHKSSHWLIGGPGLLHVFTKSLLRMTKTALLAGVLVDSLFHGIVEADLVLLKLRHLVLPNDVLCLLVEIGLLVVFSQLAGSYLTGKHPTLRLSGVRSIQTTTDGVHSLEQCLIGLVAKQVPQLFETVMEEDHGLGRLSTLLEPTDETAIESLEYSYVRPFEIPQQMLWITDWLMRLLLLFSLARLLLLRFLQVLHFFLEGNDQFEPFDVDLSLFSPCDLLMKIRQSASNEVELFLGRALENGQCLERLGDGLTLFGAPLLDKQQIGLHFAHHNDKMPKEARLIKSAYISALHFRERYTI